MNIKKVLVVGAGTMGRGIAQWFAQSGVYTHLTDAFPEASEKSIELIHSSWEKLQAKGKFDQSKIDQFKSSISTVEYNKIESDYNLVVEAIVEDVKIKQDCFRQLDSKINEDCFFATNTSSLQVATLAVSLPPKRQEKFLGLHFFNPATIMKLVELVRGPKSDESQILDLYNWFEQKGKKPALCKDGPGFIVNRVARNFYGEALRLARFDEQQHYCEIDSAIRAYGFRMGPFELMDLIGIDINYNVTCSVWDAFYKNPRFEPHTLQKEMVESGRHGKKTGKGFYLQEPTRDEAIPSKNEIKNSKNILFIIEKEDSKKFNFSNFPKSEIVEVNSIHELEVQNLATFADVKTVVDLTSADHEARLKFIDKNKSFKGQYFFESTACWERPVIESCKLSCGFFDYFFYNPKNHSEYWASDDESSQTLSQILLNLDRTPHRHLLKDMGLITSRIVSLVINEAHFSIEDHLCSPDDLDRAMEFGVNYPWGPMHWSKTVGEKRIVLILDNLHKTIGLERYVVSEYLRAKSLES